MNESVGLIVEGCLRMLNNSGGLIPIGDVTKART